MSDISHVSTWKRIAVVERETDPRERADAVVAQRLGRNVDGTSTESPVA